MEANLRVTALMPMKGNSERVPNKNLKNFDGKPLYHATMNALLSSKFVQEILINTDSDLISADIAENFPSVNVIQRPEELKGDFVSMNKIIEYDMSHSDSDLYVQTHSTNPLLTGKTLDEGIQYFLDNSDKYDSIFSVTRWQTRLYWEGCNPINHDPKELIRTQDLTPVFEENSNFYIFTLKSFKNARGKRIGLNSGLFPMNKIEALDIDEPEDFMIAEVLYKIFKTEINGL